MLGHHKKEAFLDALREGATVKKACATVQVGRSTMYRERDNDPDFAAEWEDAYDEGADVLEAEAFRRATEMGSDTLLIFLLKARRPEKFRDNVKHEHTGRNGGPIQTESKRVVSLAEVVALAHDLGVPTDRQPAS